MYNTLNDRKAEVNSDKAASRVYCIGDIWDPRAIPKINVKIVIVIIIITVILVMTL
jgi:hypothetical protein